MKGGLWSPLNSEPWCTVFCRLLDMAPHLGTFLMLIKVSEKAKKMCLPWPRRWAGPCYRMPRYYVHETFRLFLVLFFFFQVWFQLWYAVALVLTVGYGYSEHRVKRNIIPAAMLVIGVASYTVCWCGFFGRKQDGSHAAAQRQKPDDKTRNQDDENNNNRRLSVFNNNNSLNLAGANSNNKGDGGQFVVPKTVYGQNVLDQQEAIGDYEDDYSEDEALLARGVAPRCITSSPHINLPTAADSLGMFFRAPIGNLNPAQIGTPNPAQIGTPNPGPTVTSNPAQTGSPNPAQIPNLATTGAANMATTGTPNLATTGIANPAQIGTPATAPFERVMEAEFSDAE